jgi:hypothetical protein
MKLIEKIGKIQENIETLVKDTDAFKYKYVTLSQIQEKMNPLLVEQKLVLIQPLKIDLVGKTYLLTEIYDTESEEVINSSIYLPEGIDPQKLGSAISYFRRYSLLALFNLETEDDDGASASHKEVKTETKSGIRRSADDMDLPI